MHPALFNSYLAKDAPVVAEVIDRSPLELQARTLAATALCEVGVNRSEEAMGLVVEDVLAAVNQRVAMLVADKGDAQLAAKGGKS